MAPMTVLAKTPVSTSAIAARPARSFLGAPLRCSVSRTQRASATARFVVKAADTEKVLTDVRKIIAEQLGTKLDDVQPDSKFVDLGADSLDTVEIMMALEEKFELELDEEGAEKISTVQEAADLIAGQVKA